MAPPSPQLSQLSNELSPCLPPTLSLPPLDLTPPSQNMSPPLSRIPSLPSLDLTPPTQNTSESDISNNFSDSNYNNTDDDFGIPFERPPSRPMVNYQNDRELEEDYEIGWEWFKCDTGPLIAPCTGSGSVFWIHSKQNLKTSSMLCLTTICT